MDRTDRDADDDIHSGYTRTSLFGSSSKGDAVGEVRRGEKRGGEEGPCWQRKEDTEQDRGI